MPFLCPQDARKGRLGEERVRFALWKGLPGATVTEGQEVVGGFGGEGWELEPPWSCASPG